MKIMKNILHKGFPVLLAGILFLAGCGQSTDGQDTSGYTFYYVDEEQGTLQNESFTPESEEQADLLQEMVRKTEASTDAFSINSAEVSDQSLEVDLDAAYSNLEPAVEILERAAMVRNFLQAPDLTCVRFSVNGEDLTDSDGKVVGKMNNDSFLEYSGKDISSYQYTVLTLYYANASGDKLVPETRSVYYASNSPVEKVVVEQLIKGPSQTEHQAVLPSDTSIIGVAVQDGIAYVNLDDRFLENTLLIQADLPIYAIVNSLTELDTVSKVQISVNGDSSRTFRDDISLDQLFEANDDLVERSDAS